MQAWSVYAPALDSQCRKSAPNQNCNIIGAKHTERRFHSVAACAVACAGRCRPLTAASRSRQCLPSGAPYSVPLYRERQRMEECCIQPDVLMCMFEAFVTCFNQLSVSSAGRRTAETCAASDRNLFQEHLVEFGDKFSVPDSPIVGSVSSASKDSHRATRGWKSGASERTRLLSMRQRTSALYSTPTRASRRASPSASPRSRSRPPSG